MFSCVFFFSISSSGGIYFSFTFYMIYLNCVFYSKRTWQTNMKRKTYRSKKRKKYIRLGETLIRIQ
ncbi:conserved Plasmodium protein, unknown function [Plasmodium ovale]|uniref:Uncharacterized protein n=1 Tax=Plasmodium ovale TaxID=36330 RepID=A0A1D3TGF1_PLAOA|nr:conserved Plasmodium protein, unknown function [Plasmodium ovale]